jgi:hypothetical protein
MKKSLFLSMLFINFFIITLISTSFTSVEDPSDIIQKTIDNIDTIETVYYKQDMVRTNPENANEIIYRYREMYYKRLIEDSIVGVKGHWYFYNVDRDDVVFEDIYDGDKLIRKNNRDSLARLYDLVKYPAFKDRPFWGHNTPYSMQYMFRYILDNKEYYQIERLNDTIIQNTECFQIRIRLENKESMPGFAMKLEDREGIISATILFVSKMNYYPIRMRLENYSIDKPERTFFTDQTYYDLKFNIKIDTARQFNTSSDLLTGYKIIEMKP